MTAFLRKHRKHGLKYLRDQHSIRLRIVIRYPRITKHPKPRLNHLRSNAMTVQRHFALGFCPYCNMRLLRSPQSVAEPIVFCATPSCRAGGRLKDVEEGRERLIPGFVSEAEIDEMLGEMMITRKEISCRE
jgi:hypothetical protein